MSEPLRKLFGRGIKQPLLLLHTGGLAESEGENRLWEAVQEIIDTPQGTRPMQPTFGVPPLVYEIATDARQIAWAVGIAIERHEPRAKDITVAIESVDNEGTIRLKIGIVPIGTATPLNKVFPVFRKSS